MSVLWTAVLGVGIVLCSVEGYTIVVARQSHGCKGLQRGSPTKSRRHRPNLPHIRILRSCWEDLPILRSASSSDDAYIDGLEQQFPPDKVTFASLYADKLPSWLLHRLELQNWTVPTPIQRSTLDAIYNNSTPDIIVQAETGSGKTLAYLLPLLADLDPSRVATQAVILVPTRELGLQVMQVARQLVAAADHQHRIIIMPVLPGSQLRRQRAWAWAEPPHVIVATPAELHGMIAHGGVKRINTVSRVVVDEVDACLLQETSGGGSMMTKPLHELLSQQLHPTYAKSDVVPLDDHTDASVQRATPRRQRRHTMLVSATVPQPRHFVSQCVSNGWTLTTPTHVRVWGGTAMTGPNNLAVPATIQHGYVVAPASTHLDVLVRLLRKLQHKGNKRVLVFAAPQRDLAGLAASLCQRLDGAATMLQWSHLQDHDSDDAAKASGNIRIAVLDVRTASLTERAAAINMMQQSPSPQDSAVVFVLLAHDEAAARGLDLNVTHVIQHDVADTAEQYLHRAGRTGRNGKVGTVVSIVAPGQEFVLARQANQLGITIQCLARQEAIKASSSKVR